MYKNREMGLNIYISVISLIMIFQVSLGQNALKCGHSYGEQESEEKKEYLENLRDRLNSKRKRNARTTGEEVLMKIPVVFHLHYNSSQAEGTGGNLTEQQINDLLNEVNAIYRNSFNYSDPLNPYSGIDTKMEFCLAKRDEKSQATTGVVRYVNDNSLPQVYSWYWDPNQYLNIYISSSIPAGGGFSLLPHLAYKPHEHAVYLYSYQGYKGNSLAHEIGHYFGLYHVFEGGCINDDCQLYGDGVCDTPPGEEASNYQCSDVSDVFNGCNSDEDDTSIQNPYRSVKLGGLGDVNDPILNIMNYSLCADVHYFTQGQMDIMRSNLDHYFPELTLSKGCVALKNIDISIVGVENSFDISCSNVYEIEFKNVGIQSILNLNIEVYKGGISESLTTWTGNLINGQSERVLLSTSFLIGEEIEIKLTNPNNSLDEDVSNNSFKILAGGIQEDFTENFNNNSFYSLPLNWGGIPFYSNTPIKIQANLGNTEGGGSFNNKAIALTNSGDTIFSPVMSLLNSGNSPSINYKVAHCQETSANTSYVVYARTCESNWELVDSVPGKFLSNGWCVLKSDIYRPVQSDWVEKQLDLSAYSGKTVQLAFVNRDPLFTSSYEYYFDDFDVDFNNVATAIDNKVIKDGKRFLFPNPTTEFVYLSGITENSHYSIYTISGVKVQDGTYGPEGINVSGINGIYFLEVENVVMRLLVK